MPTPDANTDDSQRLVVVFDEARVLATEGPIKLPNRCVKGELTNSNVVGVFLYTFGAMNLCMPEDSSSDQTESGIGKFNPPVFEIDTFDEFGDDHIQGTPPLEDELAIPSQPGLHGTCAVCVAQVESTEPGCLTR